MNQYGGLIDHIPEKTLFSEKSKYSIPRKLKQFVDIITIPNTEVIRVGSSMAKIQPYFSDVDIMNVIPSSKSPTMAVDDFIVNLKKIVTVLTTSSKNNIFFSDFKAGGTHWTSSQILNEKNGNLTLHSACLMKDVIKVDMFAPYDGRYLEMSTFFVLKSKGEFINVADNYFDTFKSSLLEDIKHYKDIKPFKAIKRVWSLAKIKNDINTLKKLHKLIKSNIALMSQVCADIETIGLMVEKNIKYHKDFLIIEVDDFKERLSNILDIEFDELKVDIMIDNLLLLIINNGQSDQLMDILNMLHDYLLSVINKATLEYIQYIGFTFPTSENSKSESSITSFFNFFKTN